MAETYKGLTIRIGGDATSLQKALRSVNSSISTTESQLRKMKQALNMDPGNSEALALNLKLIGQRAVEAQSKLSQLRSSIKEIGSQKVELFSGTSSQTIKELASQTENAAARAAEAKRNYAEVVEQLAQVKSQIKGLTGINLDDELNPDDTVETMRELGMVSDEVANKYRSLRSSYEDAFNENEIAKAVVKMSDLEAETAKASAEAKSLSSRFSELSREASGIDFGENIESRLRLVRSASEDVADELDRVNNALKLDPDSVELTAIKMRAISESSSVVNEKLSLLNQKLKAMNEAGIGRLSDETDDVALSAQRASEAYDDATEKVVSLRGELEKLKSEQSLLAAKDQVGTEEYEELGVQIEACRKELVRLVSEQETAKSAFDSSSQVSEYRELQSEIAESRAQLSKLNDEMNGLTSFSGIAAGNLTSLGMSLSTTVTPAITGIGYAMVSSADSIDSAYRDMRKTVNGTEQDFEDLRQSAIDFSTTHFTSADQILSIQAIGGELGVATDDLKVFAETVSNLDIATNLDAETAAQTLGQLDNILGDLNSDKFPQFADALVRLGNNGASTEDKIAEVATRIGSMASIANFTTPEILAWSSTIASTGQGAEAAGTAISRTISDIESAVANGGDALTAFAEIAGMSADEFASAWESSPSDVLKSFIEGLVELEGSGGSAITTLDNLGITSVRQVQAIQGLMQMIGGLDNNLRMSEDAWNGVSDKWGDAGDAAREAERKAEGFSGSLQRLQNIAQATAAELGESLVPVIDGLADFLGGLYDEFKSLPSGAKLAISAFGAFVAALGPAILLGKGVVEFIGGISSGLSKLSVAKKAAGYVNKLSSALSGAESSASGLSSSLGGGFVAIVGTLAVGAVASLVAELIEQRQRSDDAKKALEELSTVTAAADSSMSSASISSGEMSYSIADVMRSSEDAQDSLIGLVEKFKEINQEVGAQIAQLNDARSAIEQYAGKSELTASEVSQLKGSVESLNEACGENFEVVRESDGTYSIYKDGVEQTKDAIYELIDAQIAQAQVEGQQQKLTDLYSTRATQVEAYTQALKNAQSAQEQLNEQQQKLADMESSGYNEQALAQQRNMVTAAQVQLENANETLASTKSALDGTDESINGVTESIGNAEEAASGAVEGFEALVKSNIDVQNVFDNDQDILADFQKALEDSGVSLDTFQSMSSSDLIAIASQWKSSGGSIVDVMDQLGIHTSDAAKQVSDALYSLSDGQVASALESAGVDIYGLSEAMASAGISAQQLNEIGTENFVALANNCGGNIDKLIFMLQNYNAQPIYNKDGSINVNDVPLTDALGNVYVWNGTQLKTQNGQVVIQTTQITDAQGLIYTWNNQGQLVDPTGTVVVDTTQLELANGEIATYNNGQLVEQDGDVIVGFETLTDCLGNMAEYNDTELKPIDGTVYCDYSELTSALSSIDALKRKDGYTAHVYLETVQTTTKRTVIQQPTTVSSSGTSSQRMSVMRAAQLTSVQVPEQAYQSTMLSASSPSLMSASYQAKALTSDPSTVSSVARSIVIDSTSSRKETEDEDSKYRAKTSSGGVYIENQNFETKVVRAEDDLYAAAPIIYRTATREARLMAK